MKKKENLPKVQPVKIKPLFGIKPNIWVSVCYLLALLLIIFFVAFLPDIVNGDKQVTFTSKAGITAVYVDDVYVGGTPFTTAIKSGNHTADFVAGDVILDSVDFKVSHPVFFNWLFPRKMSVNSDKGITEKAYENLTKAFLEDVANYSAILTYDSVFRYPPLFVNYANAICTLPSLNSSDYKEVLFTACAFITTSEMLEDAKSAYSILNIDFDFSKIEKAIANKEFKSSTEKLIGLSMRSSSTLETSFFTRSGVSINGFTFDSTPVTEAMYYYFVQNNPDWSLSNKANLVEAGLVDEYYLDGVTLSSTNNSTAVKNISYYAAKAFCEWLSKISGKEVFIPEELQWVTSSRFLDSYGVSKKVWEMTSTAYVPLLSLFDYSVYDVLEKYNVDAEVIIKGGSYASDLSKIGEYSIGTTSLSLCSDFMGFRIAWR